jgi:hypothetical protein
MRSVVVSLLLTILVSLRDRAALQLEILALRHHLHVLNRSRPQRLRLTQADRMLWVWLLRVWDGWRAAVEIVKPETIVAWHRRDFRLFWTRKSRRRVGRPNVPRDVRQLIRTMAEANPLWGAPRIHGELLKLGIDVSQATVAKYMPRNRPPSSQTWRTLLANHAGQIMAADFFVVPTATYRLSSCWSSCRTSVAVSCTWRSPPIRRRRGPPNNSARRFLGTKSSSISFATVISVR